MKDQILKFIENAKAWLVANPKIALLIGIFVLGFIVGAILL